MFKKISVTLIVVHVLFISAISHATLPRGVEEITSIEGITEYRLKNGLQVLLFPDVTQETITVNVTYKVAVGKLLIVMKVDNLHNNMICNSLKHQQCVVLMLKNHLMHLLICFIKNMKIVCKM
mgnify:CR=1 FL=1